MNTRKNYRKIDITGERFGRLVALSKVQGMRTQWLFKCDCGNTIVLPYSRILYGNQSCGCLRKEVGKNWVASHTKHGESRTKLYRKYRSMLDRCYRSDNHNYKNYGGRGIYVCEEWRQSFEAFREWAYESGYNPCLDGSREQSLDRINNDEGYTPDNCRWATPLEQQKNRRITHLYPYKGEMLSASEFADKYNIHDKSFVYLRVRKNQTLEYILNDWKRIHNIPDYLIEVAEYATLRNISPAYVKQLLNKGIVSGERVGRKWYVNKAEKEKLEAHA